MGHAVSEMKRLFLTKVPDDFDIKKDYVLVPFSFAGKEEQFPGWEHITFPNPYGGPEGIQNAAEVANKWAESLFVKIAGQLNKDLGVSHTNEFWWPVLYPWLIFILHPIYDRYCILSAFIKQRGNERIRVECQNLRNRYHFKNLTDFVSNGIFSLEFNEWVLGNLLKNNLPEKWAIIEGQSPAEDINARHDVEKQRIKFSEYVFNVGFRCYRVYGFRYISHIFFSFLLYFKKTKSKDHAFSINLNEALERLPLVPRVVQEIVEATIPLAYKNVTNNYFYKCSMKFFPKKFRIYGPEYIFNENLKIVIGRCREAGEKIIATQHGGCYGNFLVHPLSTEIEYRYDYFFSWGYRWKENVHGNIIPLPSPYLSRKKFRYDKKNESIVLVGTSMRVFMVRFGSGPLSAEWLSYRTDKVKFIQSLDAQSYRDLRYRPYMNEAGALSDQSFLMERFSDLKIIRDNLHGEIMGCKLLVLDHPGTTLNITMASNVPTVCFWDKNHWAMTPESQVYFDKLVEAKILFYDPVLAAGHINDVYNDIDSWWKSFQVQQARKEWAFRYARSNTFWWYEWIKEICKL